MRYLMTFSYDGTNYYGYQKQPSKITIQGVLETALTKINKNIDVVVHSSGRTDSKVHALNQSAHFDLDININEEKLKRALNGLINKDIYIKKIVKVNDDFHARYNVVKKEYIYKMNIGEYNPIEKNYIYQYNKNIDIKKMKKAIKYLKGTHNFKAFTKFDNQKETDFIRTIYNVKINKNKNELILYFIGNGFLRYMVRNLVGTLIDIGEGKKSPLDIKYILESEDRKKAGKTANPEGLYLSKVYY